MKALTAAAIVALFAIKSCSASAPIRAFEARQASAPVVTFYFEGPFVSTGLYADFRQSVPEDGNTYPITNSTVVYSIIPNDTGSNCTFVGADGSVKVISGSQQDLIPVALVSVTCAAKSSPIVTPTGFPNYTSFVPTTPSASNPIGSTTLPPSTVSASNPILTIPTSTPVISASNPILTISTLPPYPTATGTSLTVGSTGAIGSAPSGAVAPTGGSIVVPFTGDASRAVKSFGVLMLALIGFIAAL